MPLRLRSYREPNKFHAKRCVIHGQAFASQKEGARYLELWGLQRGGLIRNLTIQPRFELRVPSVRGGTVVVGHYTADFQYETRAGVMSSWIPVVEDVKSRATKTEAYRLRKRMVEAIYGITVTEV